MAWTWRYERADGSEIAPQAGAESFPSQADAESFLGETWRELLESGVNQVVLLDGAREVYGPMGLSVP